MQRKDAVDEGLLLTIWSLYRQRLPAMGSPHLHPHLRAIAQRRQRVQRETGFMATRATQEGLYQVIREHPTTKSGKGPPQTIRE